MTVTPTGRASEARGHAVVRILLGVVALLVGAWSYAAPAHAVPAPQAAGCAGIWVVVDYGALGGTTTACAGSYSTGTAALRSAGFTPTFDSGLLVRINALPTTPNVQESYWSYWHATRQADGSYSAWSYSSVGPSSFVPTATDAEGWRYEPVNGGYVAPGVAPPRQAATTQAPATTAAAPVTTARTTSATRAAATTAAVTQTTSPPTSEAPSAAATSASSVPEPSATEGSPSGVETSTPSPTASDASAAAASAATGAPTSTSASSLVGGVVAICMIALATAAMLFWRRRVALKG